MILTPAPHLCGVQYCPHDAPSDPELGKLQVLKSIILPGIGIDWHTAAITLNGGTRDWDKRSGTEMVCSFVQVRTHLRSKGQASRCR